MPSGFASTVTRRCRSLRSIWLGPRCSSSRARFDSDTGPTVGEDTDRPYRSCTLERSPGLGSQPDVVLLAGVAEGRDRHAADQDPQRIGDRADRNAQVAGRFAIDDHLQLGLAQGERRIEVGQAARVSACARINSSE